MCNSILEICTDVINRAQNIVILTGAGISTESGIKDFRSRTGIYQQSPEYILSLDYFFRHPVEFYQFAIENLYHPNARPNSGHLILAEWEIAGKVSSIITQNIDGLHQKAGSKNVIEFHGTMKTATCMNCKKTYTTEEMLRRKDQKKDFYICNHCESKSQRERYIKPDVVLFGDAGEWFSMEGFRTITNLIERADCILALGSTLKVTPFSNFPNYRRKDVPMIIINKGNTPFDHQSGVYVINDFIGVTLNKINEKLK